MPGLAYVFERFPSFGQTFCYREVAEVVRQGVDVQIFSIRRPAAEPPQDWDPQVVDRVHYLPDEKELVAEIDALARKRKLPAPIVQELEAWGRKTDFLRLYQAAYIGTRLVRRSTRVHAHFAGMAARTAWWLGKFFALPFSFTAHANDIFAPREFAVGLDRLVGDAAAIITVSDYSARYLSDKFPTAAARVHRVYNGIDLAQFRSRSARDDAPPSLLSVGRLIEKKGFADLIGACAVLTRRGRNLRCEILGEGPLEADLRRQIDESDLQNVVRLAGPQPQHEIIARLANATVFVLACTHEGDGGMDNLPTVIMEAMAASLPVVSTPLAGVPEMVVDGVTGKLVAERDRDALANAIEEVAFHPQLGRGMGAAGLQLAREKFDIERTTRQLIELICS